MVQFREMVSDKETKPSIAPADDIVELMNQKSRSETGACVGVQINSYNPTSCTKDDYLRQKRRNEKRTKTPQLSSRSANPHPN
jgi:hypothetical protein